MTRDIRIVLFRMGRLVAVLRANDPDAFRGLLSEGVRGLGVADVEEQDRLGCFLGMPFVFFGEVEA